MKPDALNRIDSVDDRRRLLCRAGVALLFGGGRRAAPKHRGGSTRRYLSPRATQAPVDDAFVRGMRELGYTVVEISSSNTVGRATN
jgi:hypothetical protein